VQLATAAGLSYASVIHWRDCWVLLEKQTLITALAREVMERQNIKLIWQE
jgi:microcompartment protein PduM